MEVNTSDSFPIFQILLMFPILELQPKGKEIYCVSCVSASRAMRQDGEEKGEFHEAHRRHPRLESHREAGSEY